MDDIYGELGVANNVRSAHSGFLFVFLFPFFHSSQFTSLRPLLYGLTLDVDSTGVSIQQNLHITLAALP
jgi:hypothetical protein